MCPWETVSGHCVFCPSSKLNQNCCLKHACLSQYQSTALRLLKYSQSQLRETIAISILRSVLWSGTAGFLRILECWPTGLPHPLSQHSRDVWVEQRGRGWLGTTDGWECRSGCQLREHWRQLYWLVSVVVVVVIHLLFINLLSQQKCDPLRKLQNVQTQISRTIDVTHMQQTESKRTK